MKLKAQKKNVPATATPSETRNSHVYAIGHVAVEMANATPYAPQTTATGTVSPARNLPTRDAAGALMNPLRTMSPHIADADAIDTTGSARRMIDAWTFAAGVDPIMVLAGR